MPDPKEKYIVDEKTPSQIYKKPGALKGFQTFIWNKEQKTYCGRTCSSWGKIGIFYVIFYAILAGFWYGQMSVYFLTIEDDFPNLRYLDGSVMMNAPGLGYIPRPDELQLTKETPIMQYKMNDPSTYAEFVSSIDTLLNGISSGISYVSDSCASNTGTTACDTTRSNLGLCDGSDPDYGFAEGEPCVFFQINKIIGWEPEASDSNPDETNLGNRWNSENIALHCREKSTLAERTDDTGAGSPQYFPSAGIPMGCFPYCGPSVNFTQGIAAVKFSGMATNRNVRIYCTIYAANVATDEKQKTGSAVIGFHIDTD